MRRLRVLLDANVLVDAQVRDLFLRMAEADLIEVKWSDAILAEMTKALTGKIGLGDAQAQQLEAKIRAVFPDAG